MHATQLHGYTIREIELLFPDAKSAREKLNIDEHIEPRSNQCKLVWQSGYINLCSSNDFAKGLRKFLTNSSSAHNANNNNNASDVMFKQRLREAEQ